MLVWFFLLNDNFAKKLALFSASQVTMQEVRNLTFKILLMAMVTSLLIPMCEGRHVW